MSLKYGSSNCNKRVLKDNIKDIASERALWRYENRQKQFFSGNNVFSKSVWHTSSFVCPKKKFNGFNKVTVGSAHNMKFDTMR